MTWMRVAAVVAAVVTVLGVGLPMTAQAAKGPATYTCATVTPIAYFPENYVDAYDCQGPAGIHRPVYLHTVPTVFSRTCTWGEAYGTKDNLSVIGHQCI